MSAPAGVRVDVEAAVRRLEELAAAWSAGEWTDGHAAELYRLAAPRSRMATWDLFEELARRIQGVEDAARTLLGGGR
ncbi:hypothetical protein Ssi03_51060 [Sphaerisporangium siamense]|uniref:Uncharacterized protein n=1 Tax=Sphaerisporangium siamense TaxID=795645 RepID=A0A7W7GAW9_9ACTN|nr:hypothetical protein [Sphaerisporangium siamense]MBB4702190.1 hypothetical protein [Sphaerisporangium siamense]GII87116.1 hypothetical protein Ssi03_51060 [Sphaerisporangium siamense]